MANTVPGVALRPDELQKITTALGREPTVVELHAFDAQWSEHCSYKSSRHHLRKLPTQGDGVIVGVGEDAGILRVGEHNGETYGVVVAHESHNHPSQVVPFEGAATGVGGIVRDVLCMGAEVTAIADALRFGEPVPHSHQAYVAQAAVDGIAAYGNAIGVPNIAGDVYFHPGFDDNCLVNVIALGIVKEQDIIHSRAPNGSAGWDIVLVGKATDPSGFGGASFSSVTLDAADEDANKGAVQVPDPFLKNVIMRASYQVFHFLRLRVAEMQQSGERIAGKVPRTISEIAGFKDLGAGGIMGCSSEICSAGGFGADLDLEKVNVAVPNLPPQIIAIGETQERLIWVLPPGITPDVLRIYNEEFTLPEIAHNARAVVIGKVTAEPRYVLHYNNSAVMDVDINFLTGSIKDDLPFTPRTLADVPTSASTNSDVMPSGTPQAWSRGTDETKNTGETLAGILSNLNHCSREPLYRHYDAVVRGATVIPRGYADAGVFAAVPGSSLGIALGVAGNPKFGEQDAFGAAHAAVEEAVARVIAVGARPLGLTDCLNFGNPQRIEHYSELVAAIDGLGAAARAFTLPFISGNVSLYNESKNGSAIPASAIVACVGGFADIAQTITPGVKAPGATLVRIAVTPDNAAALLAAMQNGQVAACAIIRETGIALSAIRMLFASRRLGRGLGIVLPKHPDRAGGGANHASDGLAWLAELTVGASVIGLGEIVGTTQDKPSLILGETSLDVNVLYDLWSSPLRDLYP